MEGMFSYNLFITLRSVLRLRHKSGLAPNHKIWAGLDKRARSIFYVSNITRYRRASAPHAVSSFILTILVHRHEVCALCFGDPPGPQAR
jgi:hypothetical protein